MRTIILSLAAIACSITSKAQLIASFDDQVLPSVDTYYVNYTSPGTDQGFNDGFAHFPAYFDTSSVYGNSQYYGFSYSNKTDSVTSGYTNQYSAKTGIGYGGSAKYAVALCFDPNYSGNCVKVNLIDSAAGKPVQGFYITNSTYAYNSMKYGDAFESAFMSGDWFKLSVKGYLGGALSTDSVLFYLADFLHSDTDSNYIVNTWQWVSLLPLGRVDSLLFSLTSSSNTGGYMNTPAYFCMDNFTTDENDLGISAPVVAAARLYPVPAADHLFIEISDKNMNRLMIRNMLGETVFSTTVSAAKVEINTAAFAPGKYILTLSGNNKTATSQFIKE